MDLIFYEARQFFRIPAGRTSICVPKEVDCSAEYAENALSDFHVRTKAQNEKSGVEVSTDLLQFC